MFAEKKMGIVKSKDTKVVTMYENLCNKHIIFGLPKEINYYNAISGQ